MAEKDFLQERFEQANNKALDILEAFVTEGYLKTLTNLLFYMGSERAGKALEKLPEPVRAELQKRMAATEENGQPLSPAHPDVMVDAGFVFRRADWYDESMAREFLDGLGLHDIDQISQHTEEFFNKNPILTVNIEKYAFSFNDLVVLDDRAIQKVLRETDTQVLAKALKAADKSVEDKIFRNMSKRAAEMLKEDIEFMGPIRIADVHEAQGQIIDITRRLERNGEIVIVRYGEDDLV